MVYDILIVIAIVALWVASAERDRRIEQRLANLDKITQRIRTALVEANELVMQHHERIHTLDGKGETEEGGPYRTRPSLPSLSVVQPPEPPRGATLCVECKYAARGVTIGSGRGALLCEAQPAKGGGFKLCADVNPNQDCELYKDK